MTVNNLSSHGVSTRFRLHLCKGSVLCQVTTSMLISFYDTFFMLETIWVVNMLEYTVATICSHSNVRTNSPKPATPTMSNNTKFDFNFRELPLQELITVTFGTFLVYFFFQKLFDIIL